MVLPPIITLQDICPGRDPLQRRPQHSSEHLSTRTLQDRLMLVMRQAQLGLDYCPMVATDPKLARLIGQLQGVMPQSLSTPRRYLHLGMELQAPLTVEGEGVRVQVSVNVGYRQGLPKLLDWAIRRPEITQSDRVKLWVATQHFQQVLGIAPGQLKLVVVALNLKHPPQTMVIPWHPRQQHQTGVWIQQQLLRQPSTPITVEPERRIPGVPDFDEIPEVVL